MPCIARFPRCACAGLLLLLAAACGRPTDEAHSTDAGPAPAETAAQDRTSGADFSQLVEQVGASVVNISTTRRLSGRDLPALPGLPDSGPLRDFFRRFLPPEGDAWSRSLGSGFLISEDGYLLTNAHVVEGATDIVVRLNDRREFAAKLIGSDALSDVALLKIEARQLPAATIGDPAKIKVGEWVIAIGAPFGFENSVTAGIISAKARSLPDEGYVPFLQTDVAVNPGNSGGPLINLRGEVVGINAQIYSRSGGYMGLSFAIPIDLAIDVADQLRMHGEVRRGRIGVQIQSVDAALAESFGLAPPRGALISRVEPHSPASRAGLRAGDIILEVNEEPVHEAGDLPPMIAALAPGARARLLVWRDGQSRTLRVPIGRMSGERRSR